MSVQQTGPFHSVFRLLRWWLCRQLRCLPQALSPPFQPDMLCTTKCRLHQRMRPKEQTTLSRCRRKHGSVPTTAQATCHPPSACSGGCASAAVDDCAGGACRRSLVLSPILGRCDRVVYVLNRQSHRIWTNRFTLQECGNNTWLFNHSLVASKTLACSGCIVGSFAGSDGCTVGACPKHQCSNPIPCTIHLGFQVMATTKQSRGKDRKLQR